MYKYILFILFFSLLSACSDVINTEENVNKIPKNIDKPLSLLSDTVNLGDIGSADTMPKIIKDFIKNNTDSIIYIQSVNWDIDKNIDFHVSFPDSFKAGETIDLKIKIVAYKQGTYRLKYNVLTTAGAFSFVIIFTITK